MRYALRSTLRSLKIAVISCCILLAIGHCEHVIGQANDLYETASIERLLTRQLQLKPKELRPLRPLMERESDELLSLYEYYVGSDTPDFLSLWNAVRSRRIESAVWTPRKLTRRQEKALSLARLELDERILELWLDDYLDLVNDHLELDLVQSKHVQIAFETEHRERLKILREEAGRSVRRDVMWQQLSDERERKLEQILTGSQLRRYRGMTTSPRLIAL